MIQVKPELLEPAEFIEHIRIDGPAVLAAGKRAPSTPVPSCPGWTAETVVGHLGGAYWWVEGMVRDRVTEMGEFAEKPEVWGAVCAWYEKGLSSLVRALAGVGPDELVWNWSAMGPAPARFWHRRMAHETAIHRWDIEHAMGIDNAIYTTLAADGIDEYVGIVPFWVALTPQPELRGTLGLEATDVGVSYTMSLAPDHIESRAGLDDPDAVVRAGASDLLLWLVGRLDAISEGIDVEGDSSVTEAWSTLKFG